MTLQYAHTFTLRRRSGANTSLAKGNEMISANDRLHYFVKHQLTAHLRQLASEVDRWETPMFTKETPCILIIEIRPPNTRRMDSPNWYPTVKALLDGLVDAGLLSDDNNQVIKEMRFRTGATHQNKGFYDIQLRFQSVTTDKEEGSVNG